MPTLKVGSLRHRVLLQNRTVATDPLGGQIVTWVPVTTLAGDGKVWANVRFMSGMESLRTEAIVASLRASIRILFRNDLLPTARATYNGQVFDIVSIQPDPGTGRDYLDLVCWTGANDG